MTSQIISPTDRIRELNAINADVAAMLQSAGQAIHSLSNRPLQRSRGGDEDAEMAIDDKPASLEERKGAFTQHTTAYYTNLQAVTARLRRQAYALEEAGMLAAEMPALSTGAQHGHGAQGIGQGRGSSDAAPAEQAEHITNGGLGNLDVGWLNSRGNKVGAEKEAELMEEAKKLLEEYIMARTDGEEPKADG